MRLSGKNWFAQAYYTRSQTDSTYAIDQRTKNYYDSYEELADYMKSIRGRRILNAQMRRELQSKVRKVQTERRKLLDDKEIREELMLD